MRILIENGDMFDGTEAMLDECFGITLAQLGDWCKTSGWEFSVDSTQHWDDKTKKWTKIEYIDVMNDCHNMAKIRGRITPLTAWLDLDGIWWPNPFYTGDPVSHPENADVFHPAEEANLRERYEEHKNVN